jgi:hypothetical protein
VALAEALRGVDTVGSFPQSPCSGAGKPLYFGHPEFEGFTVLQEVKAEGTGSVAAE